MPKIAEVLAANLKRLRGNLSRKELASMSGVSFAVIRDTETGAAWPGLANIAKLAEHFMIEEHELFIPEHLQPHEIEDCFRAIGEQLNLIDEMPDK